MYSIIDTCDVMLEMRRNGSDLEVVAASGTCANGTAAFVLESLSYEANDNGAETLLLEINYWATGRYEAQLRDCLLYTSPSPRDQRGSRMPSSA